jgi:hypothetical protein
MSLFLYGFASLISALGFWFGHSVVGGGGGSDAAAADTTTLGPISPIPAILGAASDLSRDVTSFTTATTLSSTSGVTVYGSFPLFEHAHFRAVVRGRLSATVVGPLRVSLTGICTSATSSLPLCTGIIAARKTPLTGSFTTPTSFESVSRYAHSMVVTHNALSSAPATLQFGPGIHLDGLLVPVLGRPPTIVYAINLIGFTSAILTVAGDVRLSGLDETSF